MLQLKQKRELGQIISSLHIHLANHSQLFMK